MIKKYIRGEGVDVSRIHFLKESRHFFVEPDNFYSLRESFDFESLNFIYSKNLINETKFYKILIKEWLNFCKVNGHIIIEMQENEILDFEKLVGECKLLSRNNAKIILEERKGSEVVVVLKKTKKMLKKGDDMGKWTFGIVVDGRRDKEVDDCIESIEKMNIPNYEIILCGEKYDGKNKEKVKHLKNDPILKQHITVKKNMICEAAKYENIVIMHDRFIFDEKWYEGMKKYGNYFEALSCVIKDLKGERVDDWITFGMKEDETDIGNLGLMDYRDWDINEFIPGGFYILKKKLWEECKWDDKLVWGQAEDKRLSECFASKGFLERFNPFSMCITVTERGKWTKFPMDKKRFITPKDRPLRGKLKNGLKRICRKYILK